ncbi:MAG: dihydrolipoamide acetyltransferase family protein [Atribacterota bacterium]|nr:dihydrolipoamide acetyltransferase family protein [Atribacterota bacterium]
MAEYIIMPKLGFNMVTGSIVQWRKKEGDFIEEREVVLEIETDKTVMEVESQVAGFLKKILVPEGQEVEVTLPIGIIGDEKEDVTRMVEEAYEKLGKKASKEIETPDTKEEEIKESEEQKQVEREDIVKVEEVKVDKKISPRAKRKAQELGVKAELVEKGSGADGAIIESDIIAFSQKEQAKVQQVTEGKAVNLSSITGKKIPYTGMRKIIGDRLSKSKITSPHIYFTTSIDMTNVVKLLNRYNQNKEQRVSINDFIIFVVAKTLVTQPAVNCSLINEEIVYHDYVNIGVAVALEEGLIVPVLNNANQKGIVQISQEVKKLVKKARERKLLPEDYEGGTFTVSNLGMYGIESFTAIINPPEAAILSIGQIKKTPVVVETCEDCEEIEIRSMMKGTLSVDHRLIDGAVAATFIKQLKEYLEFPQSILF